MAFYTAKKGDLLTYKDGEVEYLPYTGTYPATGTGSPPHLGTWVAAGTATSATYTAAPTPVRLKIAIDLDGVIYPFVDELRRVALLVYPDSDTAHWPNPENYYFAEEWGLTDQEFMELQLAGILKHNLFNGEITDHTSEIALNHVLQMHDVTFLTSRDYGYCQKRCAEQTRAWLKKNFSRYKYEIMYAPDKIEHARKFDLLLDDKADTVEKWNAAGGRAFLYRQPWNTSSKELAITKYIGFAYMATYLKGDKEIGQSSDYYEWSDRFRIVDNIDPLFDNLPKKKTPRKPKVKPGISTAGTRVRPPVILGAPSSSTSYVSTVTDPATGKTSYDIPRGVTVKSTTGSDFVGPGKLVVDPLDASVEWIPEV